MNRRLYATLVAALPLLAAPALAQTSHVDPDSGARPGNVVGTGMSLPTSNNASNIDASNTRSTIAPRLPAPAGDDGSAREMLVTARRAVAAGQTGAAQEALERAETRYLDRTVQMGQTNTPSSNPMIVQITAALKAVAAHDRKAALGILDAAIDHAG